MHVAEIKLSKFTKPQSDLLIGVLIFFITLAIFWLSPNYQIEDSKYSMVVSESLLQHGSFALDDYALPHQGQIANADGYQIKEINHHLYYFFPPGSSVLSVPFVALLNVRGVSAVNQDGTHNLKGETTIQLGLAALLMATLACVFFYTGRIVLPRGWSLIVALTAALGTQVWSTASRGLWSDTWAIFLLGLIIMMLLAQESGKRRLSPVLLASLLAWMYFVRPTNAIPVIAITVYVLLFFREMFWRYALTGTVWAACFVAYSQYHFGQMLPGYYMASRLSMETFWTALAGNLFSPSRGLLVYVPTLFFVLYLLVRYRKELRWRRLVALSFIVIVGHLLASSGISPWHGGWCFGPRYSTGLVPWFVLLAILGIDAMRRWRAANETKLSSLNWHAPLGAGAMLVLLAVFIHARGATSTETARWNAQPVNVDVQPERVWDWRYPQFMAGLILPPMPEEFPVAQSRIEFASTDFDQYIWYGWSVGEKQFRWTEASNAAMVFTLDKIDYELLQIKLGVFLVPGKLDAQRVNIMLNKKLLSTLMLREAETQIHSITLPKDLLQHRNKLVLELPDAASPAALGVGSDERSLGVRAEWMEFKP